MKYIIIGCRKCGTTSLEKFMKNEKLDVIREERLFTRTDGFDVWKGLYSDRRPVIILRDPVERAWSDYCYQKYMKSEASSLSLEEKCEEKRYDPVMGDRNIIMQSRYEQWLKPWRKAEPVIYRLEEMKKIPEFPHEWKNDQKREMTQKDRKTLEGYLENRRA